MNSSERNFFEMVAEESWRMTWPVARRWTLGLVLRMHALEARGAFRTRLGREQMGDVFRRRFG